MAKASPRPLRTIKPSAGTPSVSHSKLVQAARSVSDGRFVAKEKGSARSLAGSVLSQRSVIKLPEEGVKSRSARVESVVTTGKGRGK